MSKEPDKPKPITDEDASLFREMMGGVKPLAPDNKIAPVENRPHPKVRQHQHENNMDETSFIQSKYITPVDPEETLSFARSGLQTKTIKQLRRGQIPIEANLDLHGFTIEEAAQTVNEFLQYAMEAEMRCVIIVHGKGHRSEESKPVLKSQVNHWLRQHQGILAFHSAAPKDGGVGAMYVLLKKST